MTTTQTQTAAEQQAFSNYRREGDQQFKVRGADTWYLARELDQETAERFGCPRATHALISVKGERYMLGRLVPATGKTVRVPGWHSRVGVLCDWVSGGGLDLVHLKGHLV
jgi:hypothetical protein